MTRIRRNGVTRLLTVVVGVILVGLLAVIGWHKVMLTPYQQLKTQYFTAVCDLEPYWFAKPYGDEPVEAGLKRKIDDLASALRKVGSDPNQAPALLSYLLNEMPVNVIGFNTGYPLGLAQRAKLVDGRLRPTETPAAAEALGRKLHQDYHDHPGDGLRLLLRSHCPRVVFGHTFGDGTPD